MYGKVFIQVGANRGNDTFYKICKTYNPSKIILVEPVIECHTHLRECYKDVPEVYYEHAAIVDDDSIESVRLCQVDLNHHGAHSSVIPLKDWVITSDNSRCVPAVTLTSLLKKYDLVDIGLLFIDTEGNDSRIINSIDFNRYNINTIIYENWSFTSDCFNDFNILNGISGMDYIKNKLTTLGYTVKFDDEFAGGNYLAVKV